MPGRSERRTSTRRKHGKDSVCSSYHRLLRFWSCNTPKLEACRDLLPALKEFAFEVTIAADGGENVKPLDVTWARDILEIAAQVSIATGDNKAFRRYAAMLDFHYFDCPGLSSRETAARHLLLGLQLLLMKLEDRQAEFRALERRLTQHDLRSFYVKAPVAMKDYTTLSQQDLPMPDCEVTRRQRFMHSTYMETFLKAIRDEIARNAEKSYEKISFDGASKLLYFRSFHDLQEFARSRRWHLCRDGFVKFRRARASSTTTAEVPAVELAHQMLTYHNELHSVV